MVKEITRNSWSKFCRNFSSTNQFRHANISIIDKANGERTLYNDLSFLGIALEKKGRLIEGIRLFAGQWDPEKILEPVLSVKQPTKLYLERDSDDFDRALRFRTQDGAEIRVELYGEKNPERLVEKVAYSIFEKRGYTYGRDMGDWYEAEKIVRDVEKRLSN